MNDVPSLRVAARMAHIEPFEVMEIQTLARAAEASGADVIHLEIGEPDFRTPQPVVRAIVHLRWKQPYKNGIALVGDAAHTSDQTWGQGLSLTMRSARLLRDALTGTDDWDAAGHKYAEQAHWCFTHIKNVEDGVGR